MVTLGIQNCFEAQDERIHFTLTTLGALYIICWEFSNYIGREEKIG
jgi:hypothetical protein